MIARIPLSRSQRNLYNGVLQDSDPALYLIGKTYRFHPLPLPGFLAALHATITENPVQLCVLEPLGAGYPELAPRLHTGDIVRVRSVDDANSGADDVARSWSSGILDKPLVRYTVWTNNDGLVSGLDVHTHHILLDGGATGIVEADLARHLAHAGAETTSVTQGLAKLAAAHRREAVKVDEALQRVAPVVRRELTDDARRGGHNPGSDEPHGAAAKGVLQESVTLSGSAFAAILALSEDKQVPLNVLVAAAAVGVFSSLRQSTDNLLVHAVDNRFGDPELDVATCLVNSVAHPVRFSPFASVADVVSALDRDYVRTVRRRWLREEHFRRMYFAINRTTQVEAMTLNFIREACAPTLRRFLSETPIATDIGPVEGMTVASVLDENEGTLRLTIWDRADRCADKAYRGVAARIGAALESMAASWEQPIATVVDEWLGIDPDGAHRRSETAFQPEPPTAPAWFLNSPGGARGILINRPNARAWLAWLVRNGVVPGDIVVCCDDDTDRTTDLLIACHVAGCGYSVCTTGDEMPLRASAIAEHIDDISVHVVDVTAMELTATADENERELIDGRVELVTRDARLSTRTAYVMPTSGTTGTPKLVHVTHGSLALFCAALGRAYGWGAADRILQCAPLTSDISVEEIFGAAACGAQSSRTAAMKSGDFTALAADIAAEHVTVVDLPTAVWQLLSEDREVVETIRRSNVRQIVIGGEAVHPRTADKWVAAPGEREISLVSTYGPTETTVVSSYLPITAATGDAARRVGRPLVADSMFVAFGEIVIVGDLVANGYLGIDGGGFGTVTAADGSRYRAFATADRVIGDDEGHPVFAGRKDALVKISGKRVDIAEVSRRITEDPAVSDVAVELQGGRLGMWFQTELTRTDGADTATVARIRCVLTSLGVPSFFVVAVPNIPRKPSGKVDGAKLRMLSSSADALSDEADADSDAAGLARIWSRHLGIELTADSSLLDAGIGSLDLIRILPDTRRYLNRHLTLLDLISADTAATLARMMPAGGWMDVTTAAEIAGDLAAAYAPTHQKALSDNAKRDTILVLGASGILGTGFAQAVLDLKRSGTPCPEMVFATRSELPEHEPWTDLQRIGGVRTWRFTAEPGREELDALIRDTGARTVVNCVGNTNVVVPYRDLRPANVNLVRALVDSCVQHGARLVHLSTYVVNAQADAAAVTDPGTAPYPYAASKSLAELVVSAAPGALDYTIVRLPRVLGMDRQLGTSADILVSLVDACVTMGAYPAVSLTEEVTTGHAAAQAILSLVPELGGPAVLGRGITVVTGERVSYAALLAEFGCMETEVAQWKSQLDESDWAIENPRRWSVLDAWVSLGMRLGGRSYREYLADFPTVTLNAERVAEVATATVSLLSLLQDAVTAPIA
ncbi:AMP-binding protein [Mycobacterium asiaticum]|uniref:Peptide synthase n=1 Tax=Mycobacterium asiaticum TaxID=1790 RepID=A0A1A3BDC5_MYCAS|nr:AMP-binding protein [Mycobacterium asiaticum]OBI72930.1 peptide synthase [Mycobacterium asiaticum]